MKKTHSIELFFWLSVCFSIIYSGKPSQTITTKGDLYVSNSLHCDSLFLKSSKNSQLTCERLRARTLLSQNLISKDSVIGERTYVKNIYPNTGNKTYVCFFDTFIMFFVICAISY